MTLNVGERLQRALAPSCTTDGDVTSCTAGLVSGMPLRDVQCAMRQAGSWTTVRYDMVRADLDRHAAHAVAAHLAGMDAD